MAPSDPSEHPSVAPAPTVAPNAAPTQVLEPETTPVLDDGDHDRFSHIVRKEDQMKGYVMGEPVEALCGKKWVPSRDPEKYPVCPSCLEVLGAIRAADSN